MDGWGWSGLISEEKGAKKKKKKSHLLSFNGPSKSRWGAEMRPLGGQDRTDRFNLVAQQDEPEHSRSCLPGAESAGGGGRRAGQSC